MQNENLKEFEINELIRLFKWICQNSKDWDKMYNPEECLDEDWVCICRKLYEERFYMLLLLMIEKHYNKYDQIYKNVLYKELSIEQDKDKLLEIFEKLIDEVEAVKLKQR